MLVNSDEKVFPHKDSTRFVYQEMPFIKIPSFNLHVVNNHSDRAQSKHGRENKNA